MRILIDARWIKQTGIGRYIEQTVEQILQLDKSNRYILLVRPQDRAKLKLQAPNLEYLESNEPWFTFREQTTFLRRINLAKPDLVHFTNFDFPILYRGPFVITIHDLTLLEFKNVNRSKMLPAYYHVKDAVMRTVLRKGIEKSQKVLVPTNYVKQGLLKRYKSSARKIVVTHEAADAPYPNPRVNLAKFGIDKPFLFYVGNAYPHKNLERLIIAFGKLVNSYRLDYQLVIAGRKDAFHKRLEDEVAQANLQHRVIFTNYVDDAELAGLYKKAALYVFPSLSEGFGLPPLEALGYGLPVASSKATCLPEILGNAAAYFNPKSPNDMAKVISSLLADTKQQQELVKKGKQQFNKFSWRQTAQETLAVYESVERKLKKQT
ncbi:glycosyltransferase family 4 protein [Candidatus Saccharibacteria bacterium]|nr:glycosyltransferase family 4 protein [Candidatus Saccharibacteria bacterium]